MKPLNNFALIPIILSGLLSNPDPTSAQTAHVPNSHKPPASHATDVADPYLDQVVATVETRKITRRDVTRLYLDYNPTALTGSVATASMPDGKPSRTDLPDLAPKIFGHKDGRPQETANKTPRDVPASTAELRRLAERIFSNKPIGFNDVVSLEMQFAALQLAAERRHVPVSRAEVDAGVHDALERIRVSKEMPKVAGMSDIELSHRLGSSYNLRVRTIQTQLLKRNLVLSDLTDMLGHEPQADDFYSAHVILLPINVKNPASPADDWEQARQQAEALRADIIARKKTFEDVAKQMSDDLSAKFGGNAGAVVRTLMPPDLEQAIQRLHPGEITPPIRATKYFVLMRLDKRGSDLTPAERQQALALCYRSNARERNALARVLKDIHWSNTVGQTPEWFRTPAPK